MGNETQDLKRIILILIIAFLCSWNIQQSDFHEIFLNKKTVIIISPDSTEIENMKTSLGDDFYTIADDVMFYRSQLYEVMDSLK